MKEQGNVSRGIGVGDILFKFLSLSLFAVEIHAGAKLILLFFRTSS